MTQQPIFQPKADGETMTHDEAALHFATLSVTEQDRILRLLQALIEAIKAEAQ